MFAALAPRAALLPESWHTEFSILGTTALVLLIVVTPVVVMVKDYRRSSGDVLASGVTESAKADESATADATTTRNTKAA